MAVDLEELIARAERWEPLPACAAQIAAMVAEPEPDLREVARLVETDPALTIAALRRANSAASGANRAIATVKDAVLRIGASGILQTVTRVATRKVLDQELPEYGLAAGQLWEHSRAAATGADLIGRVSQRRLPAETATTALLHDLGKLILARYLDAETRELLDRAFSELKNRRLAEREVLNVCHAELGGLLAERWQFPLSIVHGITYYQAPNEYANRLGALPETLTLCHAVQFANFLAKCLQAGDLDTASDGPTPGEHTAGVAAFSAELLASMDYLGISPLRFSELLGELQRALAQAVDA